MLNLRTLYLVGGHQMMNLQPKAREVPRVEARDLELLQWERQMPSLEAFLRTVTDSSATAVDE